MMILSSDSCECEFTYVDVNMPACMHVCVCVCVRACVRACVCVFVRLCMCSA